MSKFSEDLRQMLQADKNIREDRDRQHAKRMKQEEDDQRIFQISLRKSLNLICSQAAEELREFGYGQLRVTHPSDELSPDRVSLYYEPLNQSPVPLAFSLFMDRTISIVIGHGSSQPTKISGPEPDQFEIEEVVRAFLAQVLRLQSA